MKKFLWLFLATFLLFSCEKKQPEEIQPLVIEAIAGSETENLSIMSFNIQILGKTKSSKPDVMETIIDIIDDYDLIAIQEVRDASDITLTTLMGMLPDYYKIAVGPREGRSTSKEQAIYVYDDRQLDLIWQANYIDEDDVFERSPFLVYFEDEEKKIGFVMMNIHVDPHEAESEIGYLADVMLEIEIAHEKDIILLGDLNADGNYYDEDDLITHFPNERYNIIIGNEWNTTVSTKDNTYDRIIVTNNFSQYIIDHGVLYFHDYLRGDIELKHISDHYPIYMILEY